MVRPSKAVQKIRQKVEQKQLQRQLKKTQREAQRHQRREKVRSKLAPARIEAKATKKEVGELKQTVGDSKVGSVASTLKGATMASLSGAKAAGQAVESNLDRVEPQEYGVDFDGDGKVDGFGGPSEGGQEPMMFGGGGSPDERMDGLGSTRGDTDGEMRFL